MATSDTSSTAESPQRAASPSIIGGEALFQTPDSYYKPLSSSPSPRFQLTTPPVSHNQRAANFNAHINSNSNSTPTHALPSANKSMKPNGSNISASANVGNLGEAYSNNSSSPRDRDHPQRSLQSRNASDHPQPLRNSIRNRNGGLHSRGDGSRGYGGRRDHDRSNPDWNSPNFSSYGGRRGVPSFMRHAPPASLPPTASYIMPRAFWSPFGYPEFPFYSFASPPDAPRGMHFYPETVAPFCAPVADPSLLSEILKQVDYYFSNENLVKDIYLRDKMDEQGWVPIQLIAGFKKVSALTDNIQVVLDALRSSLVVEVQGNRVRKRNDWMRWIISSAVRSPNVSSVQSHGNSSHDTLTENIRRMSLEEQAISQSNVMGQADADSEVILGRSFSGDLNNQSQPSMNEETGPYSHKENTSDL